MVKEPYRVRVEYKKLDGKEGTFDEDNWIQARNRAREINKELEEGRTAGTAR